VTIKSDIPLKSRIDKSTVLIIDDNPANLGVISDYLQNYGFTILVDRDGESGLETAEYSRPDLILLDIKMPGIDGFETCRRLKSYQSLREIPVIFMTALTDTEDKVKGFRAGAVDYITKPFQPEEVLARVVTHLNNQALTGELQTANIALERARSELEQRVEKRTSDLSAANARLQVEITDRKQAEEEIQNLNQNLAHRVAVRTRELAALYEVAEVASQALDMKTTLQQLLERVLRAVDCHAGAIHLFDPEKQILNLAVHQGLSSNTITKIESIPRGSSWVGQVIEQGRPLIISNTPAGEQMYLSNFGADLGICAGLPMQARGEILGVLSVFEKHIHSDLCVEGMDLLKTVTDLVAVVVESTRLRQLAKKVAVTQERERLARELHDSVTQSLYSLTLLAEWGADLLTAVDLDGVQQRITEIGETARQALKEMRLLVYELRPAVLEQDGLASALQRRVDAVERRAGVEVILEVASLLKLPAVLEEGLYRIALEALNNALKHASPSLVTVQFGADNNCVTLTITDNGIGFNTLQATENSGGLGLVSMRERAEQLGGQVSIVSVSGTGTTVEVNVEIPQ
jgi:signal transduction histidine kinase